MASFTRQAAKRARDLSDTFNDSNELRIGTFLASSNNNNNDQETILSDTSSSTSSNSIVIENSTFPLPEDSLLICEEENDHHGYVSHLLTSMVSHAFRSKTVSVLYPGVVNPNRSVVMTFCERYLFSIPITTFKFTFKIYNIISDSVVKLWLRSFDRIKESIAEKRSIYTTYTPLFRYELSFKKCETDPDKIILNFTIIFELQK